MRKALIDTFGSIFFIVLGLYASFFHKTMSRIAVEWQYKLLHIRFNEMSYRIGFLAAGIAFIILGLLKLF